MIRMLTALVLVAAASAVPISRVAACDCAPVELPDAVRQADVAYVGRLVEHVRGGDNFGFPVLDEWVWNVERSRDAGMSSTVTVAAELGDGANCGVFFAAGERWLIVASVHDGTLQTNGCQPNRRMDDADADTRALVADLVSVEVDRDRPAPGSPPTPVLLIGGVAALLAAAGVLAFRREAKD